MFEKVTNLGKSSLELMIGLIKLYSRKGGSLSEGLSQIKKLP